MELQIIYPLVFVQFTNKSAVVQVWISNTIDVFYGMQLLIHALIQAAIIVMVYFHN